MVKKYGCGPDLSSNLLFYISLLIHLEKPRIREAFLVLLLYEELVVAVGARNRMSKHIGATISFRSR